MRRTELSRREFVFATAASLSTVRPVLGQAQSLTANDVAARIREHVGMPWRSSTVDGFKAGDSSTVVTGIAVTVLPTLEVLRRAAADRLNLIIVQEPTFYAPNEAPGARATDPVYLAKKAFIDEQKLVVFRLTDHWNARRPNPTAVALADVLGFTAGRSSDSEFLYRIAPTTLSALTARVRSQLHARAVRVVGPNDMPVQNVYVSPGTTDVPGVLGHLPRADVVIAGEPREWEAVPYALDSWPAGRGKGMIAVGRVVSEWPGARVAAVWIRSLVTEVPITFMSLPDPYWSPAS